MPAAVVTAEIAAHRHAEREADANASIADWRANQLFRLYPTCKRIIVDYQPRRPGVRRWEVIFNEQMMGGRPGTLPSKEMLADERTYQITMAPEIADAIIKRDGGLTVPRIFALPESWMPPA